MTAEGNARASEPTEERRGEPVCPLCGQDGFVKRLLFFTYCANPAHTHVQGAPPRNTVLEFRYCIEHGEADGCVPALLGSLPEPEP